MATDRIKKIRKRTFIITLIDFIVIFFVIIYITNYVLVVKSAEVKGFKLRFKYMGLKENMGYILNLSIETKKPRKLVIGGSGQVKFFIKKQDGETIWRKWVYPQRKTLELINQNKIIIKKSEFMLNKENVISFNAIYDNYSNGFLKDGKYLFGASLTINNTNTVISIPVIIKNGKEKRLF